MEQRAKRKPTWTLSSHGMCIYIVYLSYIMQCSTEYTTDEVHIVLIGYSHRDGQVRLWTSDRNTYALNLIFSFNLSKHTTSPLGTPVGVSFDISSKLLAITTEHGSLYLFSFGTSSISNMVSLYLHYARKLPCNPPNLAGIRDDIMTTMLEI